MLTKTFIDKIGHDIYFNLMNLTVVETMNMNWYFWSSIRKLNILPVLDVCIYPTSLHKQGATQGQFLSGI